MSESQPISSSSPEIQRHGLKQQQFTHAQAIIDKLDAQGRLEHLRTGADDGEVKEGKWTDEKTGNCVVVKDSTSKDKDGNLLHRSVELDVFNLANANRASFIGTQTIERTETTLTIYMPDSVAGTTALDITGNMISLIKGNEPDIVKEYFSPDEEKSAHFLINNIFPMMDGVIFPPNEAHA